jgi:hypothetical protein
MPEINRAVELNPAFGKDPVKYPRVWIKSEPGVQHIVEGMRKAGLSIPEDAR